MLRSPLARLIVLAPAVLLAACGAFASGTPPPSGAPLTCGSLVTLTDTTGLVSGCDSVSDQGFVDASATVTATEIVAQWTGATCEPDVLATMDREAQFVQLAITQQVPQPQGSLLACAGGPLPVKLTIHLGAALDVPLHVSLQGDDLSVVQPSPSSDVSPSPTTTAEPTPTGRPAATATATFTAVPTPTPSPSPLPPTPTATATPFPTAAPASHPDLDAFWADFILGGCGIGFPPILDDWQSVAELTDETQLVVLAKAVAIDHRYDPQYRTPMTVVMLNVDEVLRGNYVSRSHGQLELITYGHYEPPIENVLGVQHLFFMNSLGDDEHSIHRPVSVDDKYSYFMESSFENVFANVDGNVAIPEFEYLHTQFVEYGFSLPLMLQGTSFDDLVQAVKDAPTTTNLRSTRPTANRALFAC